MSMIKKTANASMNKIKIKRKILNQFFMIYVSAFSITGKQGKWD